MTPPATYFRRQRWIAPAVFVALAAPMLWSTARWAESEALAEIRDNANGALGIYVANLGSELGRFESLPQILATEESLVRLLLDPQDEVQVEAVNRHLEQVNTMARAADIYLMDATGLTLAASNWQSEKPFVGENFAFRPYFQQAMAGGLGRYFALGTTSNRRGYYFAAPVRHGSEILGAVAVKVDMARMESAWAKSGAKVIVTDPDGVIFITSMPEWKFHTLTPLADDVLARIQASLRYGDAALAPLPVVSRRRWDGGATLMRLANIGATGHTGVPTRQVRSAEYLLQSAEMPTAGWSAHILSDTAPATQRVRTTVLASAFVLAIAFLAVGYLWQRRRNLHERMALQQRAQEELEHRVAERTADLSATNRRLAKEVFDRRKAEHEAWDAREKLIQGRKLAALGQMAAGVSHELNQPLAAIRSYADNAGAFLKRGSIDQAASNLTLISELTERMGRITGQLKTYARKSGARLVPVALHRVSEQALSMLDAELRATSTKVTHDSPGAGVHVLGDTVGLGQVLVNLCQNAIDAMRDSPTKELRLAYGLEQSTVRLSVRDTGPGIPEADLARLFDPFFTTKEVGEGLGLGLSISYAIVQELQGSLVAENHPDGGAVFTVELKRAVAPAAEVA